MIKIELDSSKLLGFRLAQTPAAIGAKVGLKTAPLSAKIGAKIGSKPSLPSSPTQMRAV